MQIYQLCILQYYRELFDVDCKLNNTVKKIIEMRSNGDFLNFKYNVLGLYMMALLDITQIISFELFDIEFIQLLKKGNKSCAIQLLHCDL